MKIMSDEELNNDLYATIKSTISEVSNLKITWAAFGDRFFFNDEALYNVLKDSRDYELVSSVDKYVKSYFNTNINELDFSSYNTSATTLHQLSNNLLLTSLDKKLDELGSKKKGETNSYMFMAIQMLIARQAAIIAFDKLHYYTAIKFYKKLIGLFDLTVSMNIYKRGNTSFKGKERAKARWSEHNKERANKKRQYLKIMRANKFTTFAATATYIKQYIDTDSKPSHDTIKRWLSQASKGDFS